MYMYHPTHPNISNNNKHRPAQETSISNFLAFLSPSPLQRNKQAQNKKKTPSLMQKIKGIQYTQIYIRVSTPTTNKRKKH
jgi:hypothetical protein